LKVLAKVVTNKIFVKNKKIVYFLSEYSIFITNETIRIIQAEQQYY